MATPSYWDAVRDPKKRDQRRNAMIRYAEGVLRGAPLDERGRKKKMRTGAMRIGAESLRRLLEGARQ